MPRILYREDNVSFTAAEIARRRQGSAQDQRIAELIKILLAAGPRQAGEAFQVFLLTPADDPNTEVLANRIVNDTTAASGRPWAWTMGRRYVNLDRLKAPNVKVTSDLE